MPLLQGSNIQLFWVLPWQSPFLLDINSVLLHCKIGQVNNIVLASHAIFKFPDTCLSPLLKK